MENQLENEETSQNVSNVKSAGLDPVTGKFAPGNKLGKGNPLANITNKLRGTLLKTIAASPNDLKEIIEGLIQQAKRKDALGFAAKKLILEYVEGSPRQFITQETTISIAHAINRDDSLEREKTLKQLIESRRIDVK